MEVDQAFLIGLAVLAGLFALAIFLVWCFAKKQKQAPEPDLFREDLTLDQANKILKFQDDFEG